MKAMNQKSELKEDKVFAVKATELNADEVKAVSGGVKVKGAIPFLMQKKNPVVNAGTVALFVHLLTFNKKR